MATQQETAQQIWNYLTSKGWTKESVAALLGNAQSESGIIADRWESNIVGNMSGGYGLVQWTPATKYINWAKSNNLVYQDIISQCKRLEWEVANNQQFYSPSMTFKQFTQSTQTPEVLADIFIRSYERPYNPNQPARQTQARYWYNLLKNSGGSPKPEEKEGDEEIMFMYWATRSDGKTKDAFGVMGGNRVHLKTEEEISALKNICKQTTGRELKEYSWTGTHPVTKFVERITNFNS